MSRSWVTGSASVAAILARMRVITSNSMPVNAATTLSSAR
jgi:hypothetical protein